MKNKKTSFSRIQCSAILCIIDVIMNVDLKLRNEEELYFSKVLFEIFDGDANMYQEATAMDFETALNLLNPLNPVQRLEFVQLMDGMANSDGEYAQSEKELINSIYERIDMNIGL